MSWLKTILCFDQKHIPASALYAHVVRVPVVPTPLTDDDDGDDDDDDDDDEDD